MPTSKFESFDSVDFTFKVIDGIALEATVLIPKDLLSKPGAEYSTLVYWHGGGFVVGHRLYEGWYPPWLLDICLRSHSIIIAPAYRLLPESNAADILADVEAFWHWIHDTLPSLTTTWHARPGLTRLACAGSSAGGYLAVQSALLFPQLSRIKLLISLAGSLYTDIPYYRIPGPKVILGKRAPQPWKAERIIRNYVKNIKPGAVRTSGDPVEMWEFLTCVLQQAYLPRWLGIKRDERLDIISNLERVEEMPPIWIVHGAQDSVVPPICSTGFVEKLREVLPGVPVLLSLQPGDHGFEVMHAVQDEWVQSGLGFIGKFWP